MARDGNLQGQTSHPRRGSMDAAASDHGASRLCVGSLTVLRSAESRGWRIHEKRCLPGESILPLRYERSS